MPGIAVIGMQWGDEGKGKVIDLLADRSSHIVRAQGGNNAGHTIVAGGIESEDLDTIGINGRAALEVREEDGFEVSADDMVSLGAGTFSSPGAGMEKVHYRAVRVDHRAGGEPKGDAHPLEEVGDFQFQELSEAISWCRCGMIEDCKTEIGLCRLADYLGFHTNLGMWRYQLPLDLQRGVQPLGLQQYVAE